MPETTMLHFGDTMWDVLLPVRPMSKRAPFSLTSFFAHGELFALVLFAIGKMNFTAGERPFGSRRLGTSFHPHALG